MNHHHDNHVPERILFQWHVTDRCNLHCSHCYQDSPPAADPSWVGAVAVLRWVWRLIVCSRGADRVTAGQEAGTTHQ